ncbi:CoA transferase subunit A [Dethiosulfatarculus sandiegensis]|uniref:CoA transferase subunit A n=1 Tax=Dethiosulfatarculus sandiegensis TaxID=1429043 RepID=UPI0005C94D30|nr:CoA-transferase [Dethiosulfatarculus sandiegensis]
MADAPDKVSDLASAISTLVQPGMSLALGCALEGLIPYAAAHEIIRQKKRDLTLIGPISNICFDQIIAAGLARQVIAAWVGNVSTGIGYSFRRAVEKKKQPQLKVVNHSNFSISLALEAGSRGLPMAVGISPAGSDIVKGNPHFKDLICPHSGKKLLAIKALNPDLTILHVQKADSYGNCRLWGASGISKEAALAAEKVLITCEELVSTKEVRKDPDRTFLAGFCVDAVCPIAWGAHPAPVQGYYGLDNLLYLDYAKATKTRQGAESWLDEWIYNLKDHKAYLEKLGMGRLAALTVQNSRLSTSLEYDW